MFTGIIETIGKVVSKKNEGTNVVFTFSSTISPELKVDQSVSHNGVCLTVITILPDGQYQVAAVEETLIKSNLGGVEVGSIVNLERSMVWGGRLDGHLVQGHVDTIATCADVKDNQGSWSYTFEFIVGEKHHLVVEKGSICINGVSLTCFNVTPSSFEVAVIPYTHEHTNFHQLKPGNPVNLEFDIIGKYIRRIMESGK